MSWQEIYDLRDDVEFVTAVQKATLTTSNFGIEPTHGLFGSTDWWEQIATGKLKVETLKGRISRVFMGSMGDWPEFEMQCADGSIHGFTRHQTPSDGSRDHLYSVGNAIEVDFVWQEKRRDAAEKATPVVIAIRTASS